MAAFLRKHLRAIMLVLIFLLLFLGGLRMDPLGSFLVAAVDTLWLTAIVVSYTRFLASRAYTRAPKMLSMFGMMLSMVVFVGCMLVTEMMVLNVVFPGMDNSQMQWIYPIFRCSVLVMGIMISAFAIRSRDTRVQAEALLKEKQAMELALLRSQMDPHFVFNALNIVYSLSYTKDQKAPQMILKLADMLRYMTDECQSDFVPIEKELNYIDNFIAFQRIRYGERPNIFFMHTIENPSTLIPPMVIQPYVENCFKHGDIDTNPDGLIQITMELKENRLRLLTQNTSKGSLEAVDTRVGIGLANVERRLQLYYPSRFTINVEETDSRYSLSLEVLL